MDLPIISWYVTAVATALVVSVTLKYITATLKSHNVRDLHPLYLSGGMPSIHTALVTSLAVAVMRLDGIDSALFAAVAVFAFLVMYDSFTVRRSSGEQGDALRELLLTKRQKQRTALYVAKGHTLAEVIVGAIVGSTIGFLVTTGAM